MENFAGRIILALILSPICTLIFLKIAWELAKIDKILKEYENSEEYNSD